MNVMTLDAILRTHLTSFTHKVFSTLRPGDPFKPNWHIDAINWHLQQVVDGRIRRQIITVPPRNLKSICASVALPAWLLGRDPTREIICASYAEGLSVELHNQCRNVMNAHWYKRLYPGTQLSPRKNTETEFKTTRGGGRLATSVEGTLTGRGASVIIIDDPIKPGDAASETMLSRVRNWYDGTVLSRLNDKAEGAIILVMQRLHMDDLAGHLLAQGGWHHLNLPARAEADESIAIGPNRWHRRQTGELLHAARESADVLAEMERTLGSFGFAAQYQQQPVPIDGNLIRWSWFGRHALPLASGPDDQIVQSWDTASKDGELNDYSVCVTAVVRGNRAYLVGLDRARRNYPDLRRRAIELAQEYNPHALLIEDKGSGTHLIQELQYDGRFPVIGMEPRGDKIVRASNHSAMIEGGLVSIPRRRLGWWIFRQRSPPFPIRDMTIRSMPLRSC